MNRDQLLRALRRYARKNGFVFEVDKVKGAGSHYRIRFQSYVTTLPDKLTPLKITLILKQIGLHPDDLKNL